MTAKIIWTLIFFCSIRGVYANAAKKEIAYTEHLQLRCFSPCTCWQIFLEYCRRALSNNYFEQE